jgi:hypothetical protein
VAPLAAKFRSRVRGVRSSFLVPAYAPQVCLDMPHGPTVVTSGRTCWGARGRRHPDLALISIGSSRSTYVVLGPLTMTSVARSILAGGSAKTRGQTAPGVMRSCRWSVPERSGSLRVMTVARKGA